MTLDQQLNNLLQYLSRADHHTATASSLAAHLHVSTRQVRTYVSSINANYDTPVILSTSKGYVLRNVHQLPAMPDSPAAPSSPVSRQEYILRKLISGTQHVNIFDLSEELYASVPTIESDLKSIRKRLKDFGLSISRASDILMLTGEEAAKRALINHLIRTSSYGQFIMNHEFEFLTADYDHEQLQQELTSTLRAHNLFANDYNLQTILLHLTITVDRIRNGNIIECGDSHDLSSSPAYPAAKRLQSYIEEQFGIAINEKEFDNLHLIVFNNCMPANNAAQGIPPVTTDYIEQEYMEITQKVLMKVCRNYYLEPFEPVFVMQFAAHIKNLLLRVQTCYQLKNPFTAQIKMTCPLIYDISVFIAQQLFEQCHIWVNDDEIAFLAFHIGGYFENNTLYQSKLTCLFLYADYYNTHLKILDRIMKTFESSIQIKNAISVLNYSDHLHADFIISTVDMPFKQEHVIISPILRQQDMEKLGAKIKSLKSRKACELSRRMLSTFLHEGLFYRKSFHEKWDALKWLSQQAMQTGYASEAFQEDILNRERASSTAYCELAMPHNMQDTVYQNFISILLLEQPIMWESDKPVFMILMLGIHQASRKYFYQIFDYLIEILSDAGYRKKLLECETFPSFYEVLFSLLGTLIP